MQDLYKSGRRPGGAGYHHCYSARISSKDNKTASESAFPYMYTVWETHLVGIMKTI